MNEEDKDNILLGIYVQLSRIYDLLLVGPEADKKEIVEIHTQGRLLGPPPMLPPDEDTPE